MLKITWQGHPGGDRTVQQSPAQPCCLPSTSSSLWGSGHPPWDQHLPVTRSVQAPEGTRSSALPSHSSCRHCRALPSHSPGEGAVEKVFEPSWMISQNSICSCGNSAGKYSRQTLVISVLFSVLYSCTSDFLPIQNKMPTFCTMILPHRQKAFPPLHPSNR